MASLRLTGPAASDIAELLEWSEETFGTPARRRYEALIAAALKDVAQDWQRAGSVRRDDLKTGSELTTCGTAAAAPRAVVASCSHHATSWCIG